MTKPRDEQEKEGAGRKPRSAPPSAGGPAAGREAQLVAQLAERERQLRELTDQSLGFLEELQQVRDVARERDDLQNKLRELEQVLEITRWKLREAGGVFAADGQPAAGTAAGLQVTWSGAGTSAAAVACRREHPGLTVAWVGTPAEFDAVPAADRAVKGIEWIVHKDARTPAQCWNLAMVAARSEFVLLAGPGARIARHDAAAMAAGLARASLALACPVVRDGTSAWMGCEDPMGLLEPRALPLASGALPGIELPYPSARAFVLRRAAFERLGTFQEDLLGSAALWEYVHRARARGHSVGGLSGTELQVEGGEPRGGEAEQLERLLVLASWHPERLALAFARSDSLWRVDKPALLDLLRRVFARMPAADPAAHRALVEQVATGIVEHTVGSDVVARLVRDRRMRYLESLDTVQHEGLEAQRLAALERARSEESCSWMEALERWFADIGIGIQVRTFLAARLHDVLDHGQAREAQLLDAIQKHEAARAETARAAEAQAQHAAQVGSQLERTAVEFAHAQGQVAQLREDVDKLREDLARTREQLEQSAAALVEARTQAALLVDDLARERARVAHLEAEAAALREEGGAKATKLAELAAETNQLQAQEGRLREQLERAVQQDAVHRRELAAAAQLEEQLRRELEHAAQRDVALRRAIDEAARREEELRRGVIRRDEDLAALCQSAGVDVTTDTQRLQEVVTGLQMDSRMLAMVLHAAGAADATALLRVLRDLQETLDGARAEVGEREKWIALLLAEVVRWRLVPRDLLPHEREFLARQGTGS